MLYLPGNYQTLDKIEEFLDNTGLNMKTFNSYTETNPQITINLGSIKLSECFLCLK